MTATCCPDEVEEVKKTLGLRDANTVVLKSNPIQSQICFVKVERPPNLYGTFGQEEDDPVKPGLIHVLNRIYLNQYVRDLRRGQSPKKSNNFLQKRG